MLVRLTLAAGALLAMPLLSAPPLTTIQDVLYRADGTRFNGVLQITWNSFEASDTSNIAQQGTSVRVVDGNLRVQLVPTTNASPAGYYSVNYNSDGKVQFQETWAVPPSTNPLRVRDVRVASPSGGDQSAVTAIQESDVTGLTADLSARPVKGSGYTPGRTAFINAAGMLDGVTGDADDCVRVDGSSGPCGGTNGFADAETPGGVVDGANSTFTLAAAPDPAASLALFRNGILQKAGQDYTLASNTVQFVAAGIPQPGDTLLASYRTSTAPAAPAYRAVRALSGAPRALPGPQVLCAGTGAGTAEASCAIAAGALRPGDRVEIRFDYARPSGSGTFTWEVRWGRAAAAGSARDGLVTGRMDAAIHESGAQVSWQSWGAASAVSSGAMDAAGAIPASIEFRSSGAQLRNFSVLRYPRP
ncbi:MAG TPA: hypothetical protein VFA33_18365 [Bryobacteraceae bacterium]|nr:hypothetical protein [Bryobacteraceae bacterium]